MACISDNNGGEKDRERTTEAERERMPETEPFFFYRRERGKEQGQKNKTPRRRKEGRMIVNLVQSAGMHMGTKKIPRPQRTGSLVQSVPSGFMRAVQRTMGFSMMMGLWPAETACFQKINRPKWANICRLLRQCGFTKPQVISSVSKYFCHGCRPVCSFLSENQLKTMKIVTMLMVSYRLSFSFCSAVTHTH